MTDRPNPDSHRDPREKVVRLLGDDQRKNTRRQYGAQQGSLVQCYKHGVFYPTGEQCPDCLSWSEMLEERARKNRESEAAARVAADARGLADTIRASVKTLGQHCFEQHPQSSGNLRAYVRPTPWSHLHPSDQLKWERWAADNRAMADKWRHIGKQD